MGQTIIPGARWKHRDKKNRYNHTTEQQTSTKKHTLLTRSTKNNSNTLCAKKGSLSVCKQEMHPHIIINININNQNKSKVLSTFLTRACTFEIGLLTKSPFFTSCLVLVSISGIPSLKGQESAARTEATRIMTTIREKNPSKQINIVVECVVGNVRETIQHMVS